MAENHLYEFPKQIRLERPEPRDWPSFQEIEARHPDLCMEEHVMIFEAEIAEANRRRRENNPGV